MTGDGEEKTFEQAWRERFVRFAELYEDDAGIAGWSPSGLGARFRRFRALWEQQGPSPGRWLDAGCGAGTYSRYLSEQGQIVTGLDFSVPALRKAAVRARGQTDWVAGEVSCLPFATAAFDGALCFGVTQALWTPEPTLHELSRVIRPGGRLWIDGLNGHSLAHLIQGLRQRERRGRLRYVTVPSLRRDLKAAGFRRIRLHWVPILPAGLRRTQSLLESVPLRAVLRGGPGLGSLVSHAFLLDAERMPD